MRPPEERFWSRVRKGDGCWIWTGAQISRGYGSFSSRHLAHRFAFQLANGPIPVGMEVCHRCDVKLCVRPDHLFLGTHADNMADMAAKGRSNRVSRLRGESHPNARITDAQIAAMRALRGSTTAAAIGRAFGVSGGYASALIAGRKR